MNSVVSYAASWSMLLVGAIPAAADSGPGSVPEWQTFASYADVGYDQPQRPQFHFTSRKNWLNDPNGMVWYAGEYHLFFQHNPLSNKSGNKSWGHAVSPDMLHWKQLPHAILPYNGGTIYSGTAVIDHNNVLGRQVGDVRTIVAFFTHAKRPFSQVAAFSTDRGRTFTLLSDGKPVVPNQGLNPTERDPKVFWHEPSQQWVMVLWLKKAGADRPDELGKVRFFTSKNLLDWSPVSDFDREWVYECMDLVQLPVDGDPNCKKWLLYDADFDYEIGEFDGTSFSSDGYVGKGDFGPVFYAGQTFNNPPDGRTTVIGWLRKRQGSVFEKSGMPFSQQMSFPTTMELRRTPQGIRLFRWPIEEVKQLYMKTHVFNGLHALAAAEAMASIRHDLLDISMSLDMSSTGCVELEVNGNRIQYNKDAGQLSVNHDLQVPVAFRGNRFKLRLLLDRTSLEAFINDGETVVTDYLQNPGAGHDLGLAVHMDGDAVLESLVVHELKSVWPAVAE
jgi:fructan beta-fructosidase